MHHNSPQHLTMNLAPSQCIAQLFARSSLPRRSQQSPVITSPVCLMEGSRRKGQQPMLSNDKSVWPSQRVANSARRRSVLDLVSGLVEINVSSTSLHHNIACTGIFEGYLYSATVTNIGPCDVSLTYAWASVTCGRLKFL